MSGNAENRRTGIKRIFDFFFALTGLVFFSPLIVCIAMAVFITMGSPVFFRQKRPGYKGRPFTIIKFRTMHIPDSDDDQYKSDEKRLTSIGFFLRKTSMDELPELWNVLKGDMSMVGPRPLLMEYLDRYTDEQKRRHDVLPGITGWAQVNGRNIVSWEERFKLDLWYVDHRSFWLDLKILCMTVMKVVKREGISAKGYATMPEFTGLKNDGKVE